MGQSILIPDSDFCFRRRLVLYLELRLHVGKRGGGQGRDGGGGEREGGRERGGKEKERMREREGESERG